MLDTGLEATVELVDGSIDVSLLGLRSLVIVEHRLIAHQVRIVEEGIAVQELSSVNYFLGLDTPDDPMYSWHLMDVLIRFAVEYDKASEVDRIRVREAVLLAHQAAITKVGVVEGEISLHRLQSELGRVATNPG